MTMAHNGERGPSLNDHQAAVVDLFEEQSRWHVASLAERLETTTSGAARTANVLDRLGLLELVAYPPAEYVITPKGYEWWEAHRTFHPHPRGVLTGVDRRRGHSGGSVTSHAH